jgi:mono/diheme cytochrome c family protein
MIVRRDRAAVFEDIMTSSRGEGKVAVAHRLSAWVMILLFLLGCRLERRKSDAELGLNPQQGAGRRVYDDYCQRCHEPYSSRSKKGPAMKDAFRRPFLPSSGLPANDQQVSDIIRYGRSTMPAYGPTLTQTQIDDLLAYLHTL